MNRSKSQKTFNPYTLRWILLVLPAKIICACATGYFQTREPKLWHHRSHIVGLDTLQNKEAPVLSFKNTKYERIGNILQKL